MTEDGFDLLDVLSRGPLVLDSAIGTRLIDRGLSIRDDDPAIWNLTHPDVVESLHLADLNAGSDIILTNTFGANRDWLARFDKAEETVRLNRAAAAIARPEGRPHHFLIGSIGPGFVHLDSVVEQAEILQDGGVDAILFETFTFERATASLSAVRSRAQVPVFVSIVDWREPLIEQAGALENLGASAVGTNCVSGLERVARLAMTLRISTKLPILMKPSAGLPSAPLDSPTQFRKLAKTLFALGVQMVGGCCGTTEAHVAEIRRASYDTLRR